MLITRQEGFRRISWCCVQVAKGESTRFFWIGLDGGKKKLKGYCFWVYLIFIGSGDFCGEEIGQWMVRWSWLRQEKENKN